MRTRSTIGISRLFFLTTHRPHCCYINRTFSSICLCSSSVHHFKSYLEIFHCLLSSFISPHIFICLCLTLWSGEARGGTVAATAVALAEKAEQKSLSVTSLCCNPAMLVGVQKWQRSAHEYLCFITTSTKIWKAAPHRQLYLQWQ